MKPEQPSDAREQQERAGSEELEDQAWNCASPIAWAILTWGFLWVVSGVLKLAREIGGT